MNATRSRTAVISGGGTGIGKAIAETLLRDGYHVALIGRRGDVLASTAASMAPLGVVHTFAADLSQPDDLEQTLREVVDDLGGRVDVIVANAGRGAARPSRDLASHRDVWTDAFTGNTIASVLLVEGLRPHLSDTARIILISSAAAGGPGAGAYGAAKAALHGWMYDLAVELGPSGVTCNVVAPGFIDETELFQGRLIDERREGLVQRTLVKRPGQPSDVADCVRWLAAEATGYVTAQVIGVDGGALVDPG